MSDNSAKKVSPRHSPSFPEDSENPSNSAQAGAFTHRCVSAEFEGGESVQIPLGKSGRFALVDACDAERVLARRWQIKRLKNGLAYGQTTWTLERGRGGKKASISLHRFVSCALPGQEIDHVDGDGLNNTRANLRYCTHRENCENKVRSTNTLRRRGFKGTSYHKHAKKWGAYICAGARKPNGERKQIHLGLFATAEEAGRAYDRAALEHFGTFASLNFPDDEAAEFAIAFAESSTDYTRAPELGRAVRKTTRAYIAKAVGK